MNKQMKQHLEAVIDAIVEGNTVGAKESFHDYLRAKTQVILLGEADDEDKKEDDKDDKKDDKKSDDKDDKKPAFLEKAEKKAEKKDDKMDDKDCE